MPNILSGNKGEWSEVYAFFKLLSEGRLYAADANLNKNESIFYDILKIVRKEEVGYLNFVFDTENSEIVVQDNNGETKNKVSTQDFATEAGILLRAIASSNKASFEIVETSEFLDEILCKKIKAPSDDKSGITIKVHDSITGYQPTLGFSIKSRLGKPSTLLNAGANTNFIYQVVGNIGDVEMEHINNMFIEPIDDAVEGDRDISIKNRMKYLQDNGLKLKFFKMARDSFSNNLMLIDSHLPEIIAQLLLEYYVEGKSNLVDALKIVSTKNPMNYDLTQGHEFYEYKVKKLITESALGMLPGRVWTGRAVANGGYIIVREDGEVLCYHLYNRNDFEDYLLSNVRFERASARRHGFGVIEKNGDNYFIKLNLQIRFIK